MLLLALLLTLPSHARRAAPPQAETLVSICGELREGGNALAVGKDRVALSGEFRPRQAGKWCVVGEPLAGSDGAFALYAKRFAEARPGISYPVMVCGFTGLAVLVAGEPIRVPGPLPEKEAPFGWCADGRSVPVHEADGWHFSAEQYRPAPDPHTRSGLSIGNQ